MGDYPPDPTNKAVAKMIEVKSLTYAARKCRSVIDEDDLAQEMALSLLENKERLVAHTASQNTLIDRSLTRAAFKVLRHQRAKQRDCRRTSHIGDIASQYTEPSTKSCDKIDLQLDVYEVISLLPPELQEVAHLLKFHSVVEIQAKLDLSRQTVRGRIDRLREIFAEKKLFPAQPFRAGLGSVTGEEIQP